MGNIKFSEMEKLSRIDYLYDESTPTYVPIIAKEAELYKNQIYKTEDFIKYITDELIEGKFINNTEFNDGLDTLHETIKGEIPEYINYTLVNAYRITDTLDSPDLDYLDTQSNPPSGWVSDASSLSGRYLWKITARITNTESFYNWANGHVWTEALCVGGITTSTTGADGSYLNYVYFRTNTNPAVVCTSTYKPKSWTPTTAEAYFKTHDYITWSCNEEIIQVYDRPLGVTEDYPFEYACVSKYDSDTDSWGDYSIPFIWSHYGTLGTDGDGVEYIFKLTSTYTRPVIKQLAISNSAYQEDDYLPYDGDNLKWLDNPADISEDYPYEWVSIRKQKDGIWQEFSTPTLWAKYGKDGKDGNSSTSTDGIYFALVYRTYVPTTANPKPAKPYGGSYDFKTKTLTAPTGWSKTLTDAPVWESHKHFYLSNSITENWSEPTRVIKNASELLDETTNIHVYNVVLYLESNTTPSLPTFGNSDCGMAESDWEAAGENIYPTFVMPADTSKTKGWTLDVPTTATKQIWMTSNTFHSDGTNTGWSGPYKYVDIQTIIKNAKDEAVAAAAKAIESANTLISNLLSQIEALNNDIDEINTEIAALDPESSKYAELKSTLDGLEAKYTELITAKEGLNSQIADLEAKYASFEISANGLSTAVMDSFYDTILDEEITNGSVSADLEVNQSYIYTLSANDFDEDKTTKTNLKGYSISSNSTTPYSKIFNAVGTSTGYYGGNFFNTDGTKLTITRTDSTETSGRVIIRKVLSSTLSNIYQTSDEIKLRVGKTESAASELQTSITLLQVRLNGISMSSGISEYAIDKTLIVPANGSAETTVSMSTTYYPVIDNQDDSVITTPVLTALFTAGSDEQNAKTYTITKSDDSTIVTLNGKTTNLVVTSYTKDDEVYGNGTGRTIKFTNSTANTIIINLNYVIASAISGIDISPESITALVTKKGNEVLTSLIEMLPDKISEVVTDEDTAASIILGINKAQGGSETDTSYIHLTADLIVAAGDLIAENVTAESLNIDNVTYINGKNLLYEASVNADGETVYKALKDVNGKITNYAENAELMAVGVDTPGESHFFADGHGQLAGGKILWGNYIYDENGNITTDSDGTPVIDNTNGIFGLYIKGIINAFAGLVGGWTIAKNYLYSKSGNDTLLLNPNEGIKSTSTDQAEPNWQLNVDGSGSFANGAISWTNTGAITFSDTAKSAMGTGATGKGISSITTTYQMSTSGTTTPTGTWVSSTSELTLTKGLYLWTKIVITYSDDTTADPVYTVSYIAKDGTSTSGTGETGTSVEALRIMYTRSSSSSTVTSDISWSEAVPTPTSTYKYIWRRIDTKYSDLDDYTLGIPVYDEELTVFAGPSLITTIDSNGVKIYSSENGTTHLDLNSTSGVDLYDLGTDVAHFGKDSLWLGNKENNSNHAITANESGSGHVAYGNIAWDESGNITFANGVTVSWTPKIVDGYWYLGDTPLNVKAEGEDGTSVKILGSKTSEDELPTTGNTVGDGYLIDGVLYIWSSDNKWENVGTIQGPQGVTPHIGKSANGEEANYWYIGTTNTGIKAKGDDGTAPTVTIGENGNWYINGVDSNRTAIGDDGHSPYINTSTGTWYEWDSTANGGEGAYTDTNIKAEGIDAHSPQVSSSNTWLLWNDEALKYEDSGKSVIGDDGHSPYIGSDGYWYEWNDTNEQFENSGVLARGDDGTSVSIKDTLSSTSSLPTDPTPTNGDGYIIGEDLWVYTGGNEEGMVNGFKNVGAIKGPKGDTGDSATQYYIHYVYCDDPTNITSSNYSTSTSKAYVGIYVDTTLADATYDKVPSSTVWSKVEGAEGAHITAAELQYAISASNLTTQDFSLLDWSSTVSYETNKYTWTRFKYTDSNGSIFYSTPTLDDYVNKIGTKTTYIGSTGIYSGTVATDHLVAGDTLITNALISNLDASKITSGTIDADRIGASSITAEKIDATNLEVDGANVTGTLTANTIQQATSNPLWALNSDGTGLIAGNNISWTSDGTLTFTDNVKIQFANLSITPNVSSINFGRDEDDNLVTEPLTITINVVRNTDTTSEVISIPTGYSIKYGFDNNSVNNSYSSSGLNISASSGYYQVVFNLLNSSNKIVASATVGITYQLPISKISVTYGRSKNRTNTNAYTSPGDLYQDKWFEEDPGVQGLYVYLWQREILYLWNNATQSYVGQLAVKYTRLSSDVVVPVFDEDNKTISWEIQDAIDASPDVVTVPTISGNNAISYKLVPSATSVIKGAGTLTVTCNITKFDGSTSSSDTTHTIFYAVDDNTPVEMTGDTPWVGSYTISGSESKITFSIYNGNSTSGTVLDSVSVSVVKLYKPVWNGTSLSFSDTATTADISSVDLKGATGATWKPTITNAGDITWAKDSSDTNPASVNIMGPLGISALSAILSNESDTIDVINASGLTGSSAQQRSTTITIYLGTTKQTLTGITVDTGDSNIGSSYDLSTGLVTLTFSAGKTYSSTKLITITGTCDAGSVSKIFTITRVFPSMVNKGNWTAGTSYAINDYVYNASNYASYICKIANKDATFTAANWTLMSERGKTGATGGTGSTGNTVTTETLYYASDVNYTEDSLSEINPYNILNNYNPITETGDVHGTGDNGPQWTKVVPSLNTLYPYYFTCILTITTTAAGVSTATWSTPIADKTSFVSLLADSSKPLTTYIDGYSVVTENSISRYVFTGELSANTGTIGGWDINATTLSKTNAGNYLSLNSTSATLSVSDGTNKIYLNASGGIYELVTSDDTITTKWQLKSDGSGLLATGAINWDINGYGKLANKIYWNTDETLLIGGDYTLTLGSSAISIDPTSTPTGSASSGYTINGITNRYTEGTFQLLLTNKGISSTYNGSLLGYDIFSLDDNGLLLTGTPGIVSTTTPTIYEDNSDYGGKTKISISETYFGVPVTFYNKITPKKYTITKSSITTTYTPYSGTITATTSSGSTVQLVFVDGICYQTSTSGGTTILTGDQ